MASDIASILQLEVPLIVCLGECRLPLAEVVGLVPGTIIELDKLADEELDLLVNNKQIGSGVAVKVGENFGIQITFIGDLRERIEAMAAEEEENGQSDADLEALAAAMLSGQG